MEYEALKQLLTEPEEVRGRSFEVLREITRHVNRRSSHNAGRDLVIRALAVRDSFEEAQRPVLTALVRSVGLFPYMTDHLAEAGLDDRLAYELHRADNMGGGIVFHSLQAKIFHQLISGANVVLSASTSVGKSLVIDALIASRKYRKIVVVVPTLALIDETRRRLLHRFGAECTVVTHPTQTARSTGITIYVLTQERVLTREDLDDIDLFVIDEFYKADLRGDDDLERAIDLNLAFYKLARTEAQFYFLGPNIRSVQGLEKFEYHFIPSEFSTVAVDVVSFNLPTRGNERNEKLLELVRTLEGPTIIYCQSPRSATHVAALLERNADLPEIPDALPAAEWMDEQYDPSWVVGRALRHGIGVHHGGVPRALQQHFIRLFNERKIPFLVCTSTIIEGVNTVAQNVVVYDRRKSQDLLTHFTYKNIEGRAGRMREYFIGKVYVLEAPPEAETYSVEFPIGQQPQDTPLSLLLDLEDDDLTPASRERLNLLFSSSTLSPETLRANRHTLPEIQEQVASTIRQDSDYYSGLLTWKGTPDGPQLLAVCNLIYEHLSTNVLRGYAIHSGDALAWHLNSLRFGGDFGAHVREVVATRRTDMEASEAVETALRLVRNVVCYRFPRDLMVLDAIQRDVFTSMGEEAGDYKLFAEQTENLYIPSALFALDEYGVPIQTSQRLAGALLPAESLDDVLQRLGQLSLDTFDLSAFEKDVLQDVRQTIFSMRRADGSVPMR